MIVAALSSDQAGTAAGTDYQIAAASLVFLPGADEASVTMTITDDQLVEGTENVLIQLAAPANATLGVSQTVLTDILDNDNATSISISARRRGRIGQCSF